MTYYLILFALAFVGGGGLIAGLAVGIYLGRNMAQAKLIDHANRHPLDYAYEVAEVIYPDRTDIMIEVPDYQNDRLIERLPILRKHWSLN